MAFHFPRSIRALFLTVFAAMLAACQSVPAPAGFTPEQIAALKTEGFVEGDAGWALTFNERLLFASNESAIQPEQEARIATLARNLTSVGIMTARVEGHTDSTGTSAYNLTLSQARAQAVAAPLTAGGMRFTADQVVGRGEAVPMSSNDTAEGRQDNRRVVVIVTPQ
ncbi:MAG TPA: OmpA family protein [Sphingopyxis sp.]|nr:OmpA family protein [Sphingopyxis sp.]